MYFDLIDSFPETKSDTFSLSTFIIGLKFGNINLIFSEILHANSKFDSTKYEYGAASTKSSDAKVSARQESHASYQRQCETCLQFGISIQSLMKK